MSSVQDERPSRATQDAVARNASVSPSTVSKVLNGRDDVSPSTRRRVLQELQQLGYRSPSQRRTSGPHQPTLIDFVSVDLGPYSIEILRGLIDHAEEAGVEVTLRTVPAAKLRERSREEWATRLSDGGKSGLILLVEDVTPVQTLAIRERGIPVVVIDPLGPPPPGVVSIGATNWSGGKAATDHLIGLGHERIAFIGGPERAEYTQARMHGYLAALMAHNLPAPVEYLAYGPFSSATGFVASGRFFDLPHPPTAIFATSDDTAVGVLRQAHNRGLRVPEDLSVVGFDNTYVSVQSVPNLTTVAQPLQEMGRMALRTVLRLLAGETLDSDHVELATRLIVRDSTAKPIGSELR